MRRRHLTLLAASSAFALVAAGCSDDGDDDAGTSETTGSESPGDAPDLRAEATEVTVAYFEALATNEFDRADDRSDGGAALVVEWNEAVSAIDAARDTPYAVTAGPAPDVRVEIGDLVDEDGRWVADGFIELGARPPGVVAASTTAPPTTEGEPPPPPPTNVYVTDLVFERDDDGDDLELVDYRYDDVPYPVSELYMEVDDGDGDDDETTTSGDDTTTTTAGGDEDDSEVDGELTHAHRDVDGSVQYLVEHEDDADLTAAQFVPTGEGSPVDLDVYADDGDSTALAVWAGGFPGEEGTIDATFEVTDGDEPPTTATASIEVPAFPELGPAQPLNAVRDEQDESEGDESTTTTSTTEPPSEASTTTTTQDETTTTTAPPSSTTSSSSTTTSSSTSTTTTVDD